jgi:hypothetical protein
MWLLAEMRLSRDEPDTDAIVAIATVPYALGDAYP